MIDILDSHSDYEKELIPLLEGATSHNHTQGYPRYPVAPWGGFRSRLDSAHRSERCYRNMRLPRIDDAAFLEELRVLRDERPAYENIAKEIIQEATESLGTRLGVVWKDIARNAETGVGLGLQAISSSFRERRLHADKASKSELRDLIRRALDEEPGHPTDRYVG